MLFFVSAEIAWKESENSSHTKVVISLTLNVLNIGHDIIIKIPPFIPVEIFEIMLIFVLFF
jgi:hypothetical protein